MGFPDTFVVHRSRLDVGPLAVYVASVWKQVEFIASEKTANEFPEFPRFACISPSKPLEACMCHSFDRSLYAQPLYCSVRCRAGCKLRQEKQQGGNHFGSSPSEDFQLRAAAAF